MSIALAQRRSEEKDALAHVRDNSVSVAIPGPTTAAIIADRLRRVRQSRGLDFPERRSSRKANTSASEEREREREPDESWLPQDT